MSNYPEIRKELAALAANKKKRVSSFSRSMPTEWNPLQVLHPRTGFPFSDAGAWAFIADLLDSDVELEKMTLDTPPGKEAYVMKVDGYKGRPKIYIKIHFGSNGIVGRSFHDDK